MLILYIVFGLIIGSFLTVCIYRIPLGREKGPPQWEEMVSQEGVEVETSHVTLESETELALNSAPRITIANPRRSLCPHCEKQLLWWHNIPLVSWLILRGRCGFCGVPISARYPFVEALSAALCALSFSYFGVTATGAIVFAFCAALVVISFIDIDYYIIPDVISLPGILLGILTGGINHLFPQTFSWPLAPNLWWSLIGALVGGGTLFLIAEIYYRIRKRIGLGMGDVKLLAMTGAFFGVEGAIYTMFVGSLTGSIIGLLLIVATGKRMNYQLPFGPYLALGTLLYIFTGNAVLL